MALSGWHNRINQKANGSQLDIYRLVPLLYDEAKFLDLQICLLEERKLRRHKRKYTKRNEYTIQTLWEKYAKDEITLHKFLKQISYIYMF